MSTDVFYWEPFPDNKHIYPQFATLITEYENGVEQRRNLWAKDKLLCEYSYNREEYQNYDKVLIFFENRQGMYDDFYLPVWRRISYLTTPASGASIIVSDTDQFSVTGGVRGNDIFIQQSHDIEKYDVISIDSLGATAGLVYLDSSLTYTYPSQTFVYVAMKARFAEDVFSADYFSKAAFELNLRFVEVK
ncbi:MAG: hypothetical protein ACTSR3_19020 [Candidatus Helarchaeota archaeon]